MNSTNTRSGLLLMAVTLLAGCAEPELPQSSRRVPVMTIPHDDNSLDLFGLETQDHDTEINRDEMRNLAIPDDAIFIQDEDGNIRIMTEDEKQQALQEQLFNNGFDQLDPNKAIL